MSPTAMTAVTTSRAHRAVRHEETAIARALEVAEAARVPGGVRSATERAVLDALSAAIAGRAHPSVPALHQQLVPTTGAAGGARVWAGGAADPQTAALLNGMAIHAYDFDDTHDAAIVHAMAVILPAALVGAELAGTGDHTLAAVAAGTELACGLGLAAGHYGGWHYTTLCGTLGAALTCAVASGADRALAAEAVGNAYVFAGGNKQAVYDSSLMKRLMPGFGARNGVLATLAARSGLGGVRGWLDGELGLFGLFYGGDARPEVLAGDSQARIAQLSFKPVPACRFTHGAIEAAQRLRQRMADDELGRLLTTHPIEVHYPALDRFAIVCRPYERRGVAEMDAQFSTAYLVATALRTGEVSFASYTPAALSDPVTGSLAERVSTICDLPVDGDTALAPIELRIGDQRERIDDVLGSIERPMQEQDQRAKLIQCIGHARGEGIEVGDGDTAWRRLRAAVGALGDAGSTVELLDVMDEIVATTGGQPMGISRGAGS